MSPSSKRHRLPSQVSPQKRVDGGPESASCGSRFTVPQVLKEKVFKMKRVIAATLIASVVSIGLIGCTEKKTSTKQEMKITTPGGTTTITTEKEIKKTGDNPPTTTP